MTSSTMSSSTSYSEVLVFCSLRTKYSYALLSTNDALGRSLTLKELAVCHTPFLSLYLLCKETVLYPTISPFLPFPWFCQTVAVITPVLNFFSGTFLLSIFTHPCFRVLFQSLLDYEWIVLRRIYAIFNPFQRPG